MKDCHALYITSYDRNGHRTYTDMPFSGIASDSWLLVESFGDTVRYVGEDGSQYFITSRPYFDKAVLRFNDEETDFLPLRMVA